MFNLFLLNMIFIIYRRERLFKTAMLSTPIIPFFMINTNLIKLLSVKIQLADPITVISAISLIAKVVNLILVKL